MKIINIKRIGLAVLLTVAGLAIGTNTFAQAVEKNTSPELPPACDVIQVPEGHKLAAHRYALGAQLYRWNGSAWVFVEPVARLFNNDDYRGEVGIHYAGPTWESNSGSKVVAARVDGCSVDPAAIDWLLLRAISNDGSGVFRRVTYIQRINTVGGKAPTAPGSAVGLVVEVPYTTEYYFYRADH